MRATRQRAVVGDDGHGNIKITGELHQQEVEPLAVGVIEISRWLVGEKD